VEKLIPQVDWSCVTNEFALKAKFNYETNALLDGYTAFAYDENTVVSLLSTAVRAFLLEVEPFGVKALYDAWCASPGDVTFFDDDITSGPVQFVCILDCWSQSVARYASHVLSSAFSQLKLTGRARCGHRCLYLASNNEEHFRKLRAVLELTGIDALKDILSARRLQLLWKEYPDYALSVRVPILEGGLDLVKAVSDTFTVDQEDESKVLVLDTAESLVDGRAHMGTYSCLEAKVKLRAYDPMVAEFHQDQVTDLIGSERVQFFPTIALRNVKLFGDLMNQGFLERSSWADVIKFNPDDESLLLKCGYGKDG
jgi:hypothetical protein